VYAGLLGLESFWEDGSLVGVRTNEVGVGSAERDEGEFEPGMEFRCEVTLLAEGAHGSC